MPILVVVLESTGIKTQRERGREVRERKKRRVRTYTHTHTERERKCVVVSVREAGYPKIKSHERETKNAKYLCKALWNFLGMEYLKVKMVTLRLNTFRDFGLRKVAMLASKESSPLQSCCNKRKRIGKFFSTSFSVNVQHVSSKFLRQWGVRSSRGTSPLPSKQVLLLGKPRCSYFGNPGHSLLPV